MPQASRVVLWLFVALLLALGVSVSSAADRKITMLPGNDLPGGDYSVLKGITLNACETACTGDNLCHAFTFNQKANWCFLKSVAGTPAPFSGATSGTLESGQSAADIAKARTAELPFPPQDMIDTATSFANGLSKSDPAPKGANYAALVKGGDEGVANANPDGAMASYRQALGLNGNDPAVWLKLAALARQRSAVTTKAGGDDSAASNLASVATSSALNAFLRTQSTADRAAALASLAQGLELQQQWPQAIATYRASIAIVDDPALETALDAVTAQHGFRVASNSVDAETASPRICAVFSDSLPGGNVDISGYVSVDDAPGIAVDVEQSQICITGVEHGRRYHVRLRAGLPAASGESLRKDVDLNLYVPDRKPFVGFANNAYVLPVGLGAGLPITSVNATSADLTIYRIGDRAIADAVRNGVFGSTLDQDSANQVANAYGDVVWKGTVDLTKGAPNDTIVTAIPVNDALKSMQPGAYVVTAKVSDAKGGDSSSLATQWFIVTDLGLSSVSGDDGIHAFVRSLSTAKPIADANVRLIAVNNEILGESKTDASGEVTFAPGLARGDGGRAPQVLSVSTTAGDYSILDMSKSGFDLTDRGVAGRTSPGPLDLYATTERGVYRPGETVFITGLLRDAHAKAVAGLPLTVDVERPDGVVASHKVLNDQGAGGYFEAVPLVASAMRGSWDIKLYADPKADPLTTLNFLVEDFEPDRLAFDVDAPKGPIAAGQVTAIKVAAKYLYGATAPNLAVQADTIVTAQTTLDGYPGYSFGRADDNFEADRQSLGTVGTTDESGNAEADITLPAPAATTKPLSAQVILTLVDTNGRTVQHTLDRPVLATGNHLGIKPKFDPSMGLPEGSTAGFSIVAVDPQGKSVAAQGLTWSLSRIDTNYQWYREDGVWKWEAITTTRHMANGTVDTLAGVGGSVSATVSEGRYQLEVDSTGDNPTSTTYQFDAGYYYAQAGSDTPDKLRVALDKPAYRTGDTAHLRLDPQFAGTALVMVVADRVIAMQAVDVPAGGATIDLPVTDDWSPGAYVTATLYRPADAAEKRMPNRALGLAFANVDPGDRKLAVSIGLPSVAPPRQALSASIKLGNVPAGTKAYVAVAAVDLGILNLTNFQPPNPDGWFFGQRQLGVEFRDLYGQLIDPTQGIAGALRTGGDSGAPRLGTPPPTAVLVALDSGVVTVGPDGTATVNFTMPDFSGTVRIMAMAWTDTAVGHATGDVIVRDPVVVTLSPPEFLRIGDKSRLLVEINNVSGPAGAYQVALDTGTGITSNAGPSSVTLAAGARTALNLDLVGAAAGDEPIKLTVTGPTGVVQLKQLTLGVRAPSTNVTTSSLIPLAPGATATLDASRFAGLLPHSAAMLLGVGPMARLDVPDLLAELDRYPYGCAEQISSRALPLLYLNDVAVNLGLGSDAALSQRVKDSIASLLANQTSSGAFGLWGPSDDNSDDLWLDSYVTDFLLRAKDKGYAVPAQALDTALDNLGNGVSAAADFSNGGEDIAYALYDLAHAGRAAIGDLRYYFEAKLDAFGSPLAKAQLGAALSLYGDRARGAKAFAAAITALAVPDNRKRYRTDYGSQLRDAAGILALAGDTTPPGVDIGALTQRVADLRDLSPYTSTQEDAWTLLAAASLAKQTANGTITIDGAAVTGSVYRRYDQEHFDKGPVTIVNTGNQPTEVKALVTGIPSTPLPAGSHGFALTRQYYRLDGTKFDPTKSPVHQNDRFVVVLSAAATTLGSGQYVINDPLPAGFSIENADLAAAASSNSSDNSSASSSSSSDDSASDDSSSDDNSSDDSSDDQSDSSGDQTSSMSWLSVDTPSHAEARTDAYVATFSYSSDTPTFSTAYMVRATTPGSFVLPGATVEDMYRPEFRANTATGKVEVLPPKP